LTAEEGRSGTCPLCKAPLSSPEFSERARAEQARPYWRQRRAVKPAPWRIILVLLVCIGGVFGLLCVSCMGFAIWWEQNNKSALAYNEKLASAQARFVASRNSLTQRADDHLIDGAPAPNRADLQQRLGVLRSTIDSIRTEMAAWSPPSGARELHQGYERYLEDQKAQLPKFARVIDLVADDKLDQAATLLDELDAGEDSSFNKVGKLQEEFAAHHGLILTPAPLPPNRIAINPRLRELPHKR
jgi:hypothetical protein